MITPTTPWIIRTPHIAGHLWTYSVVTPRQAAAALQDRRVTVMLGDVPEIVTENTTHYHAIADQRLVKESPQ